MSGRRTEHTAALTPIAYTAAQAAARLQLSVTEVYRMCRRGQLKHRRVGRRVLISVKAVDEFIEGATNQ